MESSVTQEASGWERVVRIDEGRVRSHVDGLVRSTATATCIRARASLTPPFLERSKTLPYDALE
jgi:hypothetical protein